MSLSDATAWLSKVFQNSIGALSQLMQKKLPYYDKYSYECRELCTWLTSCIQHKAKHLTRQQKGVKVHIEESISFKKDLFL